MHNKIETFTGLHDFLSNTYISTFIYEGISYKTVTHAFNASKLKNVEDKKKIAQLKTTQEVFHSIRNDKYEYIENWQDISENIMLNILRKKFSNPFLKDKLLKTGEDEIVTKKTFVGKLLMKIRDELNRQKQDDIIWT